MSRIFISHSSRDDLEAVALRDWLAAEGWDDVFLDFDPNRGIVAGQSWERRLNEAASRCEAVVFLVSANWLASGWCLKEYTTARRLNKKLFAVLIDPDKPIGELPPELTDTWQVTDLASGKDMALFRAVRPGTQQEKQVGFNRDGLTRLKRGLEKAGLDPRFFAWPPDDEPGRAPFRGLKPLEAADAGIFFGRDAPIVEAADRLRGLGFGAPPRLMVLLGASGAGKSSFLRAGLLPRLARDDRHFVCLPPIRPERAAITGENGLLQALGAVCTDRTPAAIASAVAAGAAALRPLLADLVHTVFQRTLAEDDASVRPTVVIAIDQAEELFRPEGAGEAHALLDLLRDLTGSDDPVAVAAIFAIRSDTYDALEHARELEGLRQDTMPLLPMARGAYKDVIEGPIRRIAEAGGKLSIEPQLTARLMDDIERGAGSDALPLLAFTLEQLYLAQGHAATLRLASYQALGGLGGAIDAAVERAFARADNDPNIPRARLQREALLRRGLIPWLAGIDPETRSPRRNIARLADVPAEAKPLVALLVEERLLSVDTVRDCGDAARAPVATVEPTHEALLRQWGLLAGWLAEDFALLATLEGVQRASRDWAANAGDPAWLAHGGGRLAEAQALDSRPDIAAKLDATDRAYITDCRNRDDAVRAELEQRRRERDEEQERRVVDAQALTAATRRTAQRTRIGLVASLVLAVAAGGFGLFARSQKTIADQKTVEAEHQTGNARQAAAEATRQKNIATTQEKQAQTEKRRADDSAATATRNAGLAEDRLRASQRSESLSLAEQSLRETAAGDTTGAIKLALKALPADPEQPERPIAARALYALERAVWSHRLRFHFKSAGLIEGAQFTSDGARLLASGRDGALSLLDAGSGSPIWKIDVKRGRAISSALSADGLRVATLHQDPLPGSMVVRRMSDGAILSDIPIPNGFAAGGKVALSPDGRRLFYTGGIADADIRSWDVDTGRQLSVYPGSRWVASLTQKLGVTPDGRYVFATAIDDAQVWDIASGAPLLSEQVVGSRTRDVVLSKNAVYVHGGTHIRVLAADFSLKASWFHTNDPAARSTRVFLVAPDESFVVLPASATELSMLRPADGSLQRVLRGHTAPIESAALSPDGSLVAALAKDDTIRVWATATGQQKHLFKLGIGGARHLSFSADSQKLMTFAGSSVFVWDVSGPSPVSRPGGLDPAWRVVKTDASGSIALVDTAKERAPSRLVLFDLAEERVTTELADGSPHLEGQEVALSPAGTFVAFPQDRPEVASAADPMPVPVGLMALPRPSRFVEVRATRSGASIARLPYETHDAPDIAFSGDEKFVCLLGKASRERSRLEVFALDGSRRILGTEQDGGEPRCLMSGQRVFLLTGTSGTTVASGWDLADGHRLFARAGLRTGEETSAEIVDGGRRLLLSSGTHPPILLDTTTGNAVVALDKMLVGVVSISPVGSGAGVLKRSDESWALWDYATRAPSETLKGEGKLKFDRASRDGRVIVLRDRRKDGYVVRAVEVATGAVLHESALTKRIHGQLVLSDDGQTLAHQAAEDKIEVVRLRGEAKPVEIGVEGAPARMLLSADGLYLVTLSNNGLWEVFDAVTGQRTFRLASGRSPIEANLFVSGKGRSAVSGALVGRGAVVVQAATGKVLWRSDDDIKKVAASGDGGRVIALHSDRAVVYDLADGTALRAFPCDTRKIFGAFTSPDGRYASVTALIDSGAKSFVVDLKRAELLAEMNDVEAIHFAEEAASIFIVERKSTIEVHDLQDGSVRETTTFPSPIKTMVMSPSGDGLLVQTEDQTVFVVDSATGAKKQITKLQREAAQLSFTATRNEILVHEASGVLSLWDVSARRRVTTFSQNWSDAVTRGWYVRTDPSKTIMAVITADKYLRVFNTETGAGIIEIPFADRYVSFVDLAVPDTASVVLLGEEGDIEHLDLAKKHSQIIYRLAAKFSRLKPTMVATDDGRVLVVDDNGTAFLVSRTLNAVATYRSSVAIENAQTVLSKNGRFLAVVGEGSGFRLWDTSAHEIIEESTIAGGESYGDRHPFISESGRDLIVAGDRTVDVVRLPPTRADLLAKARQLAGEATEAQSEKSPPRLGVALRAAAGSDAAAGPAGAILTEVAPDGPGFQAGLLPGDIVTDAGGKRVGDTQDVVQAVQAVGAGGALSLGVLRDGRRLSLVAHF